MVSISNLHLIFFGLFANNIHEAYGFAFASIVVDMIYLTLLIDVYEFAKIN